MARRKRKPAVRELAPDRVGPRCRVDCYIGGRSGRRIRKIVPGTREQVKAWLARQRQEWAEQGGSDNPEVRLPREVYAKVEELADREGRSVVAQVERMISDCLTRANEGLQECSFREVVDRFTAAKRGGKRSESYMREVDRVLVRDLVPRWGDREARTVTPDDVEQWQAERAASIGPSTIRKELAVLGTLFRWAVKRRLAAVDPCAAVDRPQLDRKRARWLSGEEFRRLWDAAGPALRDVLAVLVVTGLRANEFCGLRREDLQPEGLCVSRSKVKDFLVVPLTVGLRRLLEGQPKRKDGFLFGPRGPDGPPWTVNSLYKALSALGAAAGVQGVKCHLFRHSAATWLCAATGSIDVARRRLGHSTSRMTEQYSHTVLIDWSEQAKHLPAVLTTLCPQLRPVILTGLDRLDRNLPAEGDSSGAQMVG